MSSAASLPLTPKDFATEQEVRWCPGCGDYSILAQMKKVLANLNLPREQTVFVSGIGCSSRFPYYMNTYGFHTIHGRAPTLATGLKLARPDLQVWVVTGDGDGLSIGGNHLLHAMRRNVDIKVILFNNEIYGLKGQYSPTSRPGTLSKSTPGGSFERRCTRCSVAVAAEATFVARTVDRDIDHLVKTSARRLKERGVRRGVPELQDLQ
ncbi:MAG: 2-oxoacid:ferredoxin oxidoreductase subunit beta [Gemmataceae bacterium]